MKAQISKDQYMPPPEGQGTIEYVIVLTITNDTPHDVTLDKLNVSLTNPVNKRSLSASALTDGVILRKTPAAAAQGSGGEVELASGDTERREVITADSTSYITAGVEHGKRLSLAVEVGEKGSAEPLTYKSDMPRLDEVSYKGRDAPVKLWLFAPDEHYPQEGPTSG